MEGAQDEVQLLPALGEDGPGGGGVGGGGAQLDAEAEGELVPKGGSDGVELGPGGESKEAQGFPSRSSRSQWSVTQNSLRPAERAAWAVSRSSALLSGEILEWLCRSQRYIEITSKSVLKAGSQSGRAGDPRLQGPAGEPAEEIGSVPVGH